MKNDKKVAKFDAQPEPLSIVESKCSGNVSSIILGIIEVYRPTETPNRVRPRTIIGELRIFIVHKLPIIPKNRLTNMERRLPIC